jgi:hypothetical protein
VEANEAMRRVFWRHRWLLIVLMLIPVAAVASLRLTEPVKYAATASIQAQAAAPQVDTEVTAILSRAAAVATSPSIVQTAINAAGVQRNALDVARHEVAVTSLGSSAVVTLTVTDPSQYVAGRLARSLATGVVTALNGLGTQSSQNLAALARQRQQLEATRGTLLKQLAVAQTNNELATSAGVQSLLAQLNAVETDLSTNATSEQQVLTNSSINEGAGVISAPTDVTGVSRHVASDSALAGLLGLVIGLLIATILELSRPTIAEPAAAARELSLVLLGSAQLLPKDETPEIDDELTTRLDLAARRLDARTLVLTGPASPAQLAALAAGIDKNWPAVVKLPAVVADSANGDSRAHAGSRISGVTALSARISGGATDAKSSMGSFSTGSSHVSGDGSARAGLRVVTLPAMTLRARPEDPALVLVLPKFAPRAALDQAVDLGVTTGWPLLGVIGLRQSHKRRHRVKEPKQSTAADEKAAQGEMSYYRGPGHE